MTPTKQCEDLRRESERLIESGFAVAEREPTYTLDAMIAQARLEMGEARWNELNAEWEA